MKSQRLLMRRAPLRAAAFFILMSVFARAQTVPAAETSTAADKAAGKAAATEVVKTETKKDTKAQDAERVVALEKVEVTGTRIRSLVGEQTALPVLTIPQVELENRGVARLADVRWGITELGATIGFNDNLVNSGPSRAQQVSTSLNLRGLGGNSTLVLIDGRRVPHSGQSAPAGAGGREDFNIDGIPVSAIERVEVLPQGAGAIYGTEAIAGVVNIILKKSYRGTEVNFSYDNTFDSDVAQKTWTVTSGMRSGRFSAFITASDTQQAGLKSVDRWWSKNGDLTPYGASYNYLIYSPYAGAGTLASGYYPYSSTTVYTIPSGTNGTFTTSQATSGKPSTLYDAAKYTYLIDPAHNRSAVVKLDYDFKPWLKPYLNYRWSRFNSYYTGSPNTLTRQLAANSNGNPFSTALYLSKVFYDLPLPSTLSSQTNIGLNLGVTGDLSHEWRYDAGFAWSRNVTKDDAYNAGFDSTLLSAAVTNGVILTYDSLNGTDPNAAGLMRSLLATSKHMDTTDVYQYTAQADGPIWNAWAGAVKLAVGGEAQEEKVKFSRTPAVSYLLSSPFSRKINAGFAELSVPLLSDRQHIPLVHRLEVDGAGRFEHFSDLGRHTTPSINVLYQPTKWLTFRASRTEGFKAPKLYELQAPYYYTTTTITASRGIVDTQRSNAAVVGTYDLWTGGQPNLKPETSVSRSVGTVIDIPYVKGLSFSVDIWELNYTNKVGSPGYQVLIDYFPERVIRNSSGVITGFDTSNINMAWVKTKGVDYRLTYQHKYNFGELMFSGSFSDPNVAWSKSTPAAAATSTYGHQPWRTSLSAFWAKNGWNAGVTTNIQARYYVNGLTYAPYPSYIEWNPQVGYNFGKNTACNDPSASFLLRMFKDTKISVTIINALNKDPNGYDVANGRIVMDPRLRRYIVTLGKKF